MQIGAASFRSLDFDKANIDDIRSGIEQIDWAAVFEEMGLENFPDAFATTLLGICQEHCPPKRPPRRQNSCKMRNLSRKKRRLQGRLDQAVSDSLSSPELIRRLENNVALLHYEIRDTIVNERNFKEEVACWQS